MQNLVWFELSSIILLKALWASFVKRSASSNIIIWKSARDLVSNFVTIFWANVFTFSLIAWMPLSSEAFNSKTRFLYSPPYNSLANYYSNINKNKKKVYKYNNLLTANMALVFPVPGGP